MNMQMSFFDGQHAFHNDKPIRLIELFGGYGSQNLALKYLGIPFEHYRLSEWTIKSIQAYKDIHATNDNTDYSQGKSVEEIKAWLNGRISSDYNTPMTKQQINGLSEKQVRTIYNNMQATHNLGSITQIKAEDLAIVDTDKYCYIMTYSFPCQDLSLAGQGKGMSKGNGTRSGLLWEVERLLCEMSGFVPHRVKPRNKTIFSDTPFVDDYHSADIAKLPQILLMENVPQVVGSTGVKDFAQWIARLEELGYKNYWQLLNAKDFGIPQNRNRCFMISLLGDYFYSFPKSQKLVVRLKDFLDKEVDEKYYLTDKSVENFIESIQQATLESEEQQTILIKDGRTIDRTTDVAVTLLARDYKGFSKFYTNAVLEKSNGVMHVVKTKNKRLINMLDKIDMSKTQAIDIYNQSTHENMHTIKANIDTSNMTAVTQDFRIRKLIPKECFRLMGVKQQDFENVAKSQSTSSQYHLAGDSIVTTCLMAIFGQLFGVDYQTKINELVGELKQ